MFVVSANMQPVPRGHRRTSPSVFFIKDSVQTVTGICACFEEPPGLIMRHESLEISLHG